MIVMTLRSFGWCLSALAIAMVPACGSSEGAGVAGGGDVDVVAAFYPLQFAVEQVGGEHVTVSSPARPGAEPHDLELGPKDVAALAGADLVVYQSGFQPAVDDAVKEHAAAAALDVTGSARLDVEALPEGHEGETAEEHGAHEAPGEPDERAGKDPHFWLDPTKYAAVATAVAARLAEVDPDNADAYTARGREFSARLEKLDAEFRAGLATCASKDLVTGHAAFGYLAARYGLTQEGIAGVSPDAEPSAAAMREIAEHIREEGVKTVYAETLVSPALAETIARETGATVKVLDPVEGITDASAGKDYFEVMRSNLGTLRAGQGCS
jgi:zinc transport system substrate-binding protein